MTFTWDWGDGTADTVTVYYNDGVAADPYPSPDINPMDVTDTASHTYGDNGLYTVTLTVVDDDGGVTETTTTVIVNNVAPTIAPLAAAASDENVEVSLSGTAADPGSDDLTFTWDWGDGTADTMTVYYNDEVGEDPYPSPEINPMGVTDMVSHTYADNGEYGVTLTVKDDDGGVTKATTMVTVSNVAPTITAISNSSPGCGKAVEGDAMSVTVKFTDPGFDNPLNVGGETEETFTYRVDWGDGTTIPLSGDPDPAATIDLAGSPGVPTAGSLSESHVYADGGIYTITVRVEDDDEGVAIATTTAVITGAGIHDGVLQIIGTQEDDHVNVNEQGNGLIKVHADFLPSGNHKTFEADAVDRIYMVLCYGNDHATIAGSIDKPAIVDGGPGNDHLNGGGGSNILLGGLGDDMLIGGQQRDILIGGGGADRLVANPGEDLLIGNGTTFDSGPETSPLANDQALLDLLDIWNGEREFADRVDALFDEGLLEIVEDDADDVLTGASGEDWFFTSGGDTVTDDLSQGNNGSDKGNSSEENGSKGNSGKKK